MPEAYTPVAVARREERAIDAGCAVPRGAPIAAGNALRTTNGHSDVVDHGCGFDHTVFTRPRSSVRGGSDQRSSRDGDAAHVID